MHESLIIALIQAREVVLGYFKPTFKAHQLTEQQWRIMRVLASNNAINFHSLAKKTCILSPSLTGILTRMERDGLIYRLKSNTDQRKLYLSLTEQGKSLYDTVYIEIEKGYQALQGAVSADKIEQLYELLNDIITLGELNDDNKEQSVQE